MSRSDSPARTHAPVLITGGCGFIGTNLAHRLASAGQPVLLFDSLARPGVEQNLRWLHDTHGNLVEVQIADVRDAAALKQAVRRASQVFHFAAQVAVTTSLTEPLEDADINIRGTLNLLEAIRARPDPLPLVFTSTNKVYGSLDDMGLRRRHLRYEPVDSRLLDCGISESRPLDFHSPYGCSKGSADQYVLDYGRTFGLPTMVFRMSCIYGPHQFGTEDQGWVAHFLIRALAGQPITLYGDGCQVRDILAVDDLVDAFLLAQEHMSTESGKAFNIGGGPANTVSLLELVDLIVDLLGHKPEIEFDAWRAGDQRYYVTDIGRFHQATGWSPLVTVPEGLERLFRWLQEARAGAVATVATADAGSSARDAAHARL